MEIIIHPASIGLAPILTALHAAGFGPASWSEDQIKGSLALETTQCWLALAEGTAAGFILCQKTGIEAEILTLCVHPLYRRQGIGERLVKQAIGTRPEGGVIFLEVAADNAAASALYEKSGFKKVNVRKAYYKRGDKLTDAISYRYPPPDLQP